MIKPNNIDIEKYKIKNLDNKNTVPFEEDDLKKINHEDQDIIMLDLTGILDLNPLNITAHEKLSINNIMDYMSLEIDSKVILEITTTPFELSCLFLKFMRDNNIGYSSENYL